MTEKRYYFVGEKSKQNQAVIELVESWRSEFNRWGVLTSSEVGLLDFNKK